MASRLIAGVLLVLVSPLLGLSGLAILLADRGPVLFRAQRVGRGMRVFTMYKLRTMRVRADDLAQITGRGDQRVLRVGRVLRRLKIDELPQLANIVRGEMAFVGPRPEAPGIVERHYGQFMKESLTVLPGLTSPGSLNFFANEKDLPADPIRAEALYARELLPRKIALDLVYVRNRTLVYDIELVLRTLASTVGLHGLFKRRQRWERSQAARLLAAEAPRDEALTASLATGADRRWVK